jgi:hypothetical protein
MFLNSEFCLARAAEARAEVDAARLNNVRNRYSRRKQPGARWRRKRGGRRETR